MIPTEQRREAINAARLAWASAPTHVRLMAGAYVEPILSSLQALAADLDALRAKVEQGQ